MIVSMRSVTGNHPKHFLAVSKKCQPDIFGVRNSLFVSGDKLVSVHTGHLVTFLIILITLKINIVNSIFNSIKVANFYILKSNTQPLR